MQISSHNLTDSKYSTLTENILACVNRVKAMHSIFNAFFFLIRTRFIIKTHMTYCFNGTKFFILIVKNTNSIHCIKKKKKQNYHIEIAPNPRLRNYQIQSAIKLFAQFSRKFHHCRHTHISKINYNPIFQNDKLHKANGTFDNAQDRPGIANRSDVSGAKQFTVTKVTTRI